MIAKLLSKMPSVGRPKNKVQKEGNKFSSSVNKKNQSVAPFIVSSDIDKDFRDDMDKDFELLDPRAINAARELGLTVAQAKENATAMGITLGQLLGYEEAPKAEIAQKYATRKPLISREDVARLSTHMHRLHEWYMRETNKKHPRDWLSADVREEHHFKNYSIHIQMSELFQLYNQDAIDKSILGCYCL